MAVHDPNYDLRRRLKDMDEQMRRIRNSSSLAGTGLRCTADGVLESNTYVPATSGFKLDGGSGIAEFKDVLLYDLPNSMLANPVVPGVLSDESTGFGITTSNAAKLSGTIAVPSGFTSAAIFATARTFALDNSTTSPTDYLYSHLTLGGISAAEVPLAVSYNGGSGTSISPLAVVLTSLGSTVSYSVSAHAGFDNWGSDALNRTNVSGLILWFR